MKDFKNIMVELNIPKFDKTIQIVLALLLPMIVGCNGVDVIVIPEIYSMQENVAGGTLFGASLALCPNSFFAGAPITPDKTGVFTCPFDGAPNQCQRDSNGLTDCKGIMLNITSVIHLIKFNEFFGFGLIYSNIYSN